MTTTVAVLASVNGNPKYRSAIDGYLRAWTAMRTSRYRFEPVILDFGKRSAIGNARLLGREVAELLNWEGNSVFAAQVSRLVAADQIRADVVIPCDIDILPLDPEYFIEHLPNGGEIVLYRDILDREEVPMCYVAAQPESWKAVLTPLGTTPGERMAKVWEYALAAKYSGQHGGPGWTTDQEVLGRLITRSEEGGFPVRRLDDLETGHKRLDRSGRSVGMMVGLALTRRYSDCHRRIPVRRVGELLEHVVEWQVGRLSRAL